jgi:hypothetical protein
MSGCCWARWRRSVTLWRGLGGRQDTWNTHGPLLGRPAASWGDDGGVAPPPVAAYVHRRPHYFRQALAALGAARWVGRVPALVVSLDDASEEMIRLVEAVRGGSGHQRGKGG